MDIITVKDLHKSYDDIEAVKGISFSVKEGDFFAFLGPNGAGKSTTINIICTLLDHDLGEITVDGHKIGFEDNSIRKKVGVVFQENILDKRLTVRQNLDIRGSFYGLSQNDLDDKISEIQGLLGIDSFIDQRYGTLSGGQRRKADIARALINTPKILILDEPTTGLDPKTRAEVWDIIQKLRADKHITIFLTTHYMEETSVANQVVIINDGEIVASGSPEELKLKYSHDILKVVPTQNGVEDIIKSLGLEYDKNADYIRIKINDCFEALDVLPKIQNLIKSFEVIRGNMDDVFINITGTRLRN